MSASPAVLAAQELANMRKKIIDPIPEKILKTGNPVRIWNVSPWAFTRNMASLGSFTVPACEKGEKYSDALEIPYVVRETVPHDSSNWRMSNRFEDGMDVALGILGEGPFQNATHGIGRFGVFISLGMTPTLPELAAANKRLHEWRESQVAEADGFWNSGPTMYASIVAEHRDAATALGIEREWLKPIKEMMECPGCGVRVNPGIAVHAVGQGGCGAIINKEKYEKMQWAK